MDLLLPRPRWSLLLELARARRDAALQEGRASVRLVSRRLRFHDAALTFTLLLL